MATITQNLSGNQFSSLQGYLKKPAMGSTLLDWKWDPIIDSDLDEWLSFDKEAHKECEESQLKSQELDLIDRLHQDLNESGSAENNYWLDNFPLFEEIQPFDDAKIQSKDELMNGDPKCNDENVSFYEIGSRSPEKSTRAAEDLLSSTIENMTFLFSGDDVLYFTFEPKCNGAKNATKEENGGKSERSEGEESPMDGVPDDENVSGGVDAVEEILRNAAMELDQWESDTSRSEASSEGPASSSSSTQEDECEDPEWNPKKEVRSRVGQRAKNTRGKMPRGFRGVKTQEDKKQRKKEQNKHAAIRYRLKKKAEVSELLREEEELMKSRAKLKEKIEDLENEFRCLKSLMRDFFKAKGLL